MLSFVLKQSEGASVNAVHFLRSMIECRAIASATCFPVFLMFSGALFLSQAPGRG